MASSRYPYVPGVSEKFGITPLMSDYDMNDTCVDYDLFYIYLADAIVTLPPAVEFIEKNYDFNKYLYYSKAISSSQYNATIMSDGQIKREALTKRAFGMLLASLDDDKLRLQFCKLFVSIYPSSQKLKKQFSPETYCALDEEYQQFCAVKKWHRTSTRAFWFMGAYIVDYYHGLNGNKNLGVIVAKLSMISSVLKGEDVDQQAMLIRTHNLNVRSYIRTPAEFRSFKPLIQSEQDIIDAIYISQKFDDKHYDKEIQQSKRFAALFEYFNAPERMDEQNRLGVVTRIILDSMSLAGKNTDSFISQQTITEEELDLIYKRVAFNYRLARTDDSKLMTIRAEDYFMSILVYQIMKAVKDDRDFYYKNSAESTFIDMKAAEKENIQLHSQLQARNEEIASLRDQLSALGMQVVALKQELLKDSQDSVKDATKPLLAEISMLNHQISEMQAIFESNKAKENELYRLREFIFDMQQGGDIQVEEISLEQLVDGKRIYIFGGHINWRNKLKQKYPKLEVLDGHNTSFDEQKLLGADMVLMNTSNMSHALYYKIIEVLRKNNIPFDYLGKYHNPELLEKEISEALLCQKN